MWRDFEAAAPDLAAFGKARFNGSVAYLATIRKDGSPRVHPITPIIGHGHLFVFMFPDSPKGHDLRRDPRYALHCGVEDSDGGGGEFIVHGRATPVEDPAVRALAVDASSYTPKAVYVLFDLGIQRVLATRYVDGDPVRHRWSAGGFD
ncbi:MAG: pyridoxamine 5'-phosphate oxidase [Chloroflexi bacterium]|nr:pyridoxamine 5'-phosphate oxidase [Chloroflexota bacterium]